MLFLPILMYDQDVKPISLLAGSLKLNLEYYILKRIDRISDKFYLDHPYKGYTSCISITPLPLLRFIFSPSYKDKDRVYYPKRCPPPPPRVYNKIDTSLFHRFFSSSIFFFFSFSFYMFPSKSRSGSVRTSLQNVDISCTLGDNL